MPIYYKQDLNPDLKHSNVVKFIKQTIRISKRKKRINQRKHITFITDENIYTHNIDTKNMFENKKE